MAFPENPTDGQVEGQYYWDDSLGAWRKTPAPYPQTVYNNDDGKTYTAKMVDTGLGVISWQHTGYYTDWVEAVAVSPDGSKVYAGGRDDTVDEFNTSDGSKGWTFSGHTHNVQDLVVSPDGSKVYSACADGTVKAINTSDGSEAWNFTGHSDWARCLAISNDGTKLYSGGRDNTVREINTSDGLGGWTNNLGSRIKSVAVSSVDDAVYAGLLNGEIHRLRVSDGSVYWSQNTLPLDDVSGLVADENTDGSVGYIYAGDNGGSINLLENYNGNIQTLVTGLGNIQDICFTPDYSALYVARSNIKFLKKIAVAPTTGETSEVAIPGNGVAYSVSAHGGGGIYFGSNDSIVKAKEKKEIYYYEP